MGRGQLLRTKIKRELQAAIPTAAAAEEAAQQVKRKRSFTEKAEDYLEHFLKSIRPDDIINLAAWLGLAYIIQPLVKSSPQIVEGLKQIPTQGLVRYFNIIPQEWQKYGMIGVGPMAAGAVDVSNVSKLEDLPSWILSLAISALIIKFGPELLKTTNGIIGLGMLLLV